MFAQHGRRHHFGSRTIKPQRIADADYPAFCFMVRFNERAQMLNLRIGDHIGNRMNRSEGNVMIGKGTLPMSPRLLDDHSEPPPPSVQGDARAHPTVECTVSSHS